MGHFKETLVSSCTSLMVSSFLLLTEALQVFCDVQGGLLCASSLFLILPVVLSEPCDETRVQPMVIREPPKRVWQEDA